MISVLVRWIIHHIDPIQKDNALSTAMRNGHAWARIVEEARKCTIVCCRCHREIHAGFIHLPENCAKFNEEYSDVIKLKTKEYNLCICGGEKLKSKNFCSQVCYHNNTKKFNVTKDELTQLIESSSYEEVGRKFDVSGNAIKKRCIVLNIPLKRRIKNVRRPSE